MRMAHKQFNFELKVSKYLYYELLEASYENGYGKAAGRPPGISCACP